MMGKHEKPIKIYQYYDKFMQDACHFDITQAKFLANRQRNITEQRVLDAGGKVADYESICFCLSWDDHVDLDIHCELPSGTQCMYSNMNPKPWVSLDVDK